MNTNRLFENLATRIGQDIQTRKYNLSDMISESYKALYNCKQGSNLRKIVESHLDDVRSHPTDIDRLSHQLSFINKLVSLTESGYIKDEDLEEEQKPEEKTNECDKAPKIRAPQREPVEEATITEEDTDLTDEEVEELAKHLAEIRKNKKVAECDAPKKSVEESTKPRKLKRANEAAPVWSRYHIVNPDGETIDSYTDRKDAEDWVNQLYKDGDYKKGDLRVVDSQTTNESKSYDTLNLSEFNKKSASKAFVKTFKKLDSKLHEGVALTRQESISLYKAANSAMTHLSVELEHNPDFLDTFKESVTLLSVDVNKLLNSLKENKAPSKATMKSLAKFSEALLREDDEELPPIEDEENEFIEDEDDITEEESTEAEEFDQEYADARVELHQELAADHEDTEDPEVQDKLAQDAEEVANLPGVTDEQVDELLGDGENSTEDSETPDEYEEDEDEEVTETVEDTTDITDDELAELKKHLSEMRKAKK